MKMANRRAYISEQKPFSVTSKCKVFQQLLANFRPTLPPYPAGQPLISMPFR
jgi:hypothetical protein